MRFIFNLRDVVILIVLMVALAFVLKSCSQLTDKIADDVKRKPTPALPK